MELTPDLITQFGLMQKVSTGHAMLVRMNYICFQASPLTCASSYLQDMLIVMLVPIIIRNIYPQASL
jgi:hypothetical protein